VSSLLETLFAYVRFKTSLTFFVVRGMVDSARDSLMALITSCAKTVAMGWPRLYP